MIKITGVLTVVFIICIFYVNDKCVNTKVEWCGKILLKHDASSWHKSKYNERLIMIVKFDNGVEDELSVDWKTFLTKSQGDRACFNRSIPNIGNWHPWQITAMCLIILAAACFIAFCYYSLHYILNNEINQHYK